MQDEFLPRRHSAEDEESRPIFFKYCVLLQVGCPKMGDCPNDTCPWLKLDLMTSLSSRNSIKVGRRIRFFFSRKRSILMRFATASKATGPD